MYELQILPFWNNLKNFTWSLRPSDSLPPVSPPFWRHIAKSDFFIFANCISRDHISDLWTGIFSLGSLIVCFPSLQLGPPPVCNFGFVTFRHLDLRPEAFSHFLLRIFVILQHTASVKRHFEQVKGTTGSHCTEGFLHVHHLYLRPEALLYFLPQIHTTFSLHSHRLKH